MGFALSKKSLDKLVGVDPRMVRVVKRAIALSGVDFMVTCGLRTFEQQEALYAKGRTKPGPIVTWTMNSRHLADRVTRMGKAVDLLPAPYDWGAKSGLAPFDQMAAAMFRAAALEGVAIRWGADWDRDGKPREKGETDNPHFELA